MFVRFVPMHGADFKHAKIQVEASENLAAIRDKVGKHFNIQNFKLLYQGRLVSDDAQPMSFYKMTPNSTIHIIESAAPNMMEESPVKKPPPSEEELQQFFTAFGLAVRDPSFLKVAKRLGQRENLENIVATCPDLGKDPVACAFLTKPELLYTLLDQETLKYVHERHPGLCEAAYQLAAAVHEEKPGSKAGASQTLGGAEEAETPFAYNLDEMSDDDDDTEDMETGEINNRGQGRNRRSITADQLASAIARTQSVLGMQPAASSSGGMGGMTGFTSNRPPTSAAPGASGSSSTSTPALRPFNIPSAAALAAAAAAASGGSSSGSRGAGGITSNQLAEALALACGGAFQATPPSMNEPQQQPQAQAEQNYDSQLATMRELGIIDEGLAIRALQIMGGDLQAAIDLIYSGWSGEGDSAN